MVAPLSERWQVRLTRQQTARATMTIWQLATGAILLFCVLALVRGYLSGPRRGEAGKDSAQVGLTGTAAGDRPRPQQDDPSGGGDSD
jgi:hypothetical protein